MTQRVLFCAALAASACLVGALLAFAQNARAREAWEQRIKESEVPPPVLAGQKALAAGATIAESAERFKHGNKVYAGSWMGPDGNVDGRGTVAGGGGLDACQPTSEHDHAACQAAGVELEACEDTSEHAHAACKAEANADYWLAIAKCDNLPGDEGRFDCPQKAALDRTAALENCSAQLEARNEVCDELGEAPYHPMLDPADFSSVIDNPYFPLTPGTTFVYEGLTEQGLEHVEVFVTRETRQILGITCVQVRDTVEVAGELIEDTLDWYAQDKDGTVWYFAENVKEFEDGLVVSLAGSFTAGVDGAKPGIIMQAKPQLDDLYRQEFLIGVAEDLADVESLSESVEVPFGSFDDCLQTEEFAPLEPDKFERKYYAPGVGQVLTVKVGSGDRVELVDITYE